MPYELICGAALLICATVGAVELFGLAVRWACMPDSGARADGYWLLPLGPNSRCVELRLYTAALRALWQHGAGDCRLLLLDLGADDETLKICDIFCRDHSYATLLSPDELPLVLAAQPCEGQTR